MRLPDVPQSTRLAEVIAGDFYDDRLDLSARKVAPGDTWSRMPEVECVARLRVPGVSLRTVRLFLTFIAAMDRARDAARLWKNGVELFQSHPELFEPSEVSAISIPELRGLLSQYGVSQRHEPDSLAWNAIARSLGEGGSPVSRVVDSGVGNARDLLGDLLTSTGGKPRFPLLKGPKIGPMWVRMLVAPGEAKIDGMGIIPVAVDVHVRRVTENLGVSDTKDMSLEGASPVIQDAWRSAVAAAKIGGPPGITDTCAALDPALWTFGKYGCSHCQRTGQFMPISLACDHCRLRISTQH